MAIDLDLVRSNARFTLGQLLDRLATAGRVEVEAATTLAIATQHRRLGLCFLLGDGDPAAYARHLGHAGAAYLSTLRKVRWDQVAAPYYLATSRNAPFVDALAGGQLLLARELAARSRPTWAEGDEYQDDFDWVRAVMALLGDGAAPSPDAGACVERLEGSAVEGDPRLAACRALRDRSADDLADALAQLNQSALDETEAMARDESADPAQVAEARVLVPGVALARLALLRGLPLRGKLRLIPPLADTCEAGEPPAPDGWRTR
jgi:hypothetical protein